MKKITKPRPLTKKQTALVLETMQFAITWGSKNSGFHHAELMSVCYIALCRAVRKFDPKHPKAIPFPCFCKPYIRGELRREWKRGKVVKNAEWVEPDAVAGEKPIIPQIVENIDFEAIELNEFRPLLQKCMKILTPYERQVLRLRFFEGLNFPAIGDKMGFCRQAIHITYSKALRKIRHYLYLIHRHKRDT